MYNPFHMRVRPVPGGLVLDLSGDITKHAEEPLLQSRDWSQGLGEGRTYLIVNFTDVPAINSTGISLLIRLTRTGLKAGYKTFAYGLSTYYHKLFRMVGITEYMMVYPDEQTVLRRIEELEE